MRGQFGEIIERVESMAPRYETVRQGMQNQSVGAKQISDAMWQLTETARQASDSVNDLNEVSRPPEWISPPGCRPHAMGHRGPLPPPRAGRGTYLRAHRCVSATGSGARCKHRGQPSVLREVHKLHCPRRTRQLSPFPRPQNSTEHPKYDPPRNWGREKKKPGSRAHRRDRLSRSVHHGPIHGNAL